MPSTATTASRADYGAPEGESLRIVDVSYMPDEEFPADDAPTTELSIEVGGAQEHLSTLDDQQDHRILVSAAQDGTTQLIVSSEGHDQAGRRAHGRARRR